MPIEWIRLLHVLAGAAFIAVHGASMLLLHSIRGERSRVRLEAVLDFAANTTSVMYGTLLGVVGTGFWMGFARTSFFRRGWFWWSLALLIATSVWMWFVARPFAHRLREACELRPSGVPRVSDEELAEALGSRHSNLIAGVGVGSMALILSLMLLQPRLSEDADDSTVTAPPSTASHSVTLLTQPEGASMTLPSTNTTHLDETEVIALGREIYEVRAGGDGCASCHGSEGLGTSDGPEIIGASKSAIIEALEEEREMRDIELTPEEVEAVYWFLQTLP